MVFPCHMEQKSWNYVTSVLNLSWKTQFTVFSDFFRDSVASNLFYINISFVLGVTICLRDNRKRSLQESHSCDCFALTVPGCAEGAQSSQCQRYSQSPKQPWKEHCTKKSSWMICFDTEWVVTPDRQCYREVVALWLSHLVSSSKTSVNLTLAVRTVGANGLETRCHRGEKPDAT